MSQSKLAALSINDCCTLGESHALPNETGAVVDKQYRPTVQDQLQRFYTDANVHRNDWALFVMRGEFLSQEPKVTKNRRN